MYLSITDMTAMIIALGVALLMLIMLSYANYKLLQENRFLRSRLQVWRKRCQREHVEVPF